MNEPKWTRREVSLLGLAALGGLLAGCSPSNKNQPAAEGTGTVTTGGEEKASLLLRDPHVCRGINTCKNKGKPGTTNECAGQAHCATVQAHDCNGMNDCKGKGGCGEHPGENDCKGKGGCEVPLSAKTWPKARKKFEELMTRAGKKFGDPPPM